MGRLVERAGWSATARWGSSSASWPASTGAKVAGVIDPASPLHGGGPDADRWTGVDVAIDFSTPDSVATNVPVLARRGISLVVGTTGWSQHEATLRQAVADAGVGMVVAPNFSTGVVLFEALVAHAAKLFAPQADFGAFLHEAHHAAKKDAPSGTALLLKRAMEQAGFPRPIDVSSTRAGFIPGHAYDRLRRPGGNDYAVARGPRSHGLRARRADGGAVGSRQARLVHNAGCARGRK